MLVASSQFRNGTKVPEDNKARRNWPLHLNENYLTLLLSWYVRTKRVLSSAKVRYWEMDTLHRGC